MDGDVMFNPLEIPSSSDTLPASIYFNNADGDNEKVAFHKNDEFSATASMDGDVMFNPLETPSSGDTLPASIYFNNVETDDKEAANYHDFAASSLEGTNVTGTDFEQISNILLNILFTLESDTTKNPTTNPSTGGTRAKTTNMFPVTNHRCNNYITNLMMKLCDGDFKKERGFYFDTNDPTIPTKHHRQHKGGFWHHFSP